MMRQLRSASLCLLLAWTCLSHAGSPGEAAAAAPHPVASATPASTTPASTTPASTTPASSDVAVPQPPVPAIPPPPRSTPPPGSAEGQGAIAAEQAAAGEENPDWAVTLQRIASSVVSIDVDQTRAFDTEWNNSAQATG